MKEPWEIDCKMHSHGFMLGFKAAIALVEKKFSKDLVQYRAAHLQNLPTKKEVTERVRALDAVLWDLSIELDRLERMLKSEQ